MRRLGVRRHEQVRDCGSTGAQIAEAGVVTASHSGNFERGGAFNRAGVLKGHLFSFWFTAVRGSSTSISSWIGAVQPKMGIGTSTGNLCSLGK
jgi:hypothetical protein